VAAVVLAARGLPRLAGQIALSLAAVVAGALLAVFGQLYQTGADPFELFLTWALIIVPWTLVVRFEPLCLLHSVVLGTGLVLAWYELGDGKSVDLIGATLSVWALGALAIAGWEVQVRWARPVLSQAWLPRVWAVLGGGALALAAAVGIVDEPNSQHAFLAFGAVVVTVALVWWRYHRRAVDLFMQTVACGLLITVLSTGLGRLLLDWSFGFGNLLLLGLAITGQAAVAVAWLRRQATSTGGA
jgi:uncharacterized membrane protein